LLHPTQQTAGASSASDWINTSAGWQTSYEQAPDGRKEMLAFFTPARVRREGEGNQSFKNSPAL
jgi:hypothetical protein